MLKRILVLLDAGQPEHVIRDHALHLAMGHRTTLLLFAARRKDESAAERKRSEKRMRTFASLCQEKSIAYEIISSSTLSFADCLPWARSCDLTLLAMPPQSLSSREQKHLVRLLLEGGCPVFVARAEVKATHTVLVAWSGAAGITRAVKWHSMLMRRFKAEYMLFHTDESSEKAQRMLEAPTLYLQGHGLAAETLALSGSCPDLAAEIEARIQPAHLLFSTNPGKLCSTEKLGKTCRALFRQTKSSIFIAV